ncbi:uncharacterized protein LOC117644981 [Thrips palmi]|uniref:Uncharacterized protein LOC117644981 n=1 Tax=Thrips palmi TaxID=161013 RepID=A0A6P8YTE2_THRPL|nr:uncharacterized protein LOC117644981 [Thrips palmi]
MALNVITVATCVIVGAAAATSDATDAGDILQHEADDVGIAGDAFELGLPPEPHEGGHFLDDPFDTLLAVKAADGSSHLRLTDDEFLIEPVLSSDGTPPIQENVVDGPLLDVLLTVNGLDHALLALNRMDASLLGFADGEPERCNIQNCRKTCILHNCPGGYCDKLRRCRCFAVAGRGT